MKTDPFTGLHAENLS